MLLRATPIDTGKPTKAGQGGYGTWNTFDVHLKGIGRPSEGGGVKDRLQMVNAHVLISVAANKRTYQCELTSFMIAVLLM